MFRKITFKITNNQSKINRILYTEYLKFYAILTKFLSFFGTMVDMKLKTFIATNVPEAWEAIRRECGEDAVVVSSHRQETGGVKLVVATEDDTADTQIKNALYGLKVKQRLAYFSDVLAGQNLPPVLLERLTQNTLKTKGKIAEDALLTNALKETFSFAPYPPEKQDKPIAFVGPAGTGKTLAVAKTAFWAKANRLRAVVITLDCHKAGGVAELSTITTLLKIPLTVLKGTDVLVETVKKNALTHDLVIIDTPAVNPAQVTELALVADMNRLCPTLRTILTLPAGLSAPDADTIMKGFKTAGCSQLMVTKLNTYQSWSGILQAAIQNDFSLSAFGFSNAVTEPIDAATPDTLANYLQGIPYQKQKDLL